MNLKEFDPRVTPARPDLAAAFLRGRVAAARYAEGWVLQVRTAAAPLRRLPQPDAELATEALCGERVTVFEEQEGWAWVQLETDLYVGYLPAEALTAVDEVPPTHKVVALRSFVFPGPDIKLPPLEALPFGAAVNARDSHGDFVRLERGFMWGRHLAPIGLYEPDFVAVAERFLGVPYLWGGRTALGIDCSGLVQVALQATGRAAPRDSDHQEQGLGRSLATGEPLRRGDLVFWPGHVAIMRNPETVLHANGHAMAVTIEPLKAVEARIDDEGGRPITSVRRLQPA